MSGKVPSALGRRVPGDWHHVERFPYAAVSPPVVSTVECALPLPGYRLVYDQGREPAAVGYAASWQLSVLRRVRYDGRWLWRRARAVDEWPGALPGDTSVRAALDVLRLEGHRRVRGEVSGPVSATDRIAVNRWATTVDQVRTCLAEGRPVILGCPWYSGFDAPDRRGGSYWIGQGDLGRIRGDHAVCVVGASDQRQAVRLVASWGPTYPLVWLGYEILYRLLREEGEAAVVTEG